MSIYGAMFSGVAALAANSQALGMIETVLATTFFICVLIFCRDTRPSLANPALKKSKRTTR